MKQIIKQIAPWLFAFFVISLALWLMKPVYQLGFIKFQGDNTVNASVKWIKLCGLLLLFFILWGIKTSQSNQGEPSFHANHTGSQRIVLLCTVSILISTAVFNLWADPWAIYSSNFLESRVNPSRIIKLKFYSELAETPEMVIVGTSAAFRIAPAYIQEKIGLRAFNWAIDGGKAPEILILLNYLTAQHPGEYPQVLLMQVSERPATQGYHKIALALLPYLNSWPRLQEVSLRLSKSIDLSQLSDSYYSLRYKLSSHTKPLSGYYFLEDGYGDQFQKGFSEDAVLRQIERLPNCDSTFDIFGSDIEKIITFTEEQNSSIIFYTSPYLPVYYATYLKDNPDYQRCHQLITAYFTELAREHDHVFFKDYTLLDSINGLDGEEGFYDAGHLNPQNSNRLIDALSDTIREAYAAAEARRDAAAGGGK